MILQPFSAYLPRQEAISTHPELLKNAREKFSGLLAEGVYGPTRKAAFYIVEISDNGEQCSYGICGLMNTEDYAGKKGMVRPHEGTLMAREEVQVVANLASPYHIKPVLLTCPDDAALQTQLMRHCHARPSDLRYESGPLTVKVFLVDEPEEIAAWEQRIADLPTPIAVADGHHRISTAQRLFREPAHRINFQQYPALLVPANSLRIESYLRSVYDPELVAEEAWKKLRNHFTIAPLTQAVLPSRPGEWILAHAGEFYRLSARKRQPENDPVWFSEAVLPEVFGILDSGKDPRLQAVPASGSTESLIQLAREQPAAWHFQYYPVPMDAFFELLRQARIFPPKSTRFLPRFPSGIIAYKRNEGV